MYIDGIVKILYFVSINTTILKGKYSFHNCSIEADWSSASYWYEIVALSNSGEIELPGLFRNSLQGDSVLAEIYEKLGVTTTFNQDGILLKKTGKVVKDFSYDFIGCPDIVPAVMTTCAALKIKSEFRNTVKCHSTLTL